MYVRCIRVYCLREIWSKATLCRLSGEREAVNCRNVRFYKYRHLRMTCRRTRCWVFFSLFLMEKIFYVRNVMLSIIFYLHKFVNNIFRCPIILWPVITLINDSYSLKNYSIFFLHKFIYLRRITQWNWVAKFPTQYYPDWFFFLDHIYIQLVFYLLYRFDGCQKNSRQHHIFSSNSQIIFLFFIFWWLP